VKEDIVLVGIAFLLTVVVFAGFVNPVFALTDEKHKWSTDGTAYAAVTGKYYNIGSSYFNQGHWGEITEGNVQRSAFTRFTQLNQAYEIVFQSEKFYLQNHTLKSESYTHDGVYYIITYTDSGYGAISESSIEVEIGPPGAQ
jgi:hypothetical protein